MNILDDMGVSKLSAKVFFKSELLLYVSLFPKSLFEPKLFLGTTKAHNYRAVEVRGVGWCLGKLDVCFSCH